MGNGVEEAIGVKVGLDDAVAVVSKEGAGVVAMKSTSVGLDSPDDL